MPAITLPTLPTELILLIAQYVTDTADEATMRRMAQALPSVSSHIRPNFMQTTTVYIASRGPCLRQAISWFRTQPHAAALVHNVVIRHSRHEEPMTHGDRMVPARAILRLAALLPNLTSLTLVNIAVSHGSAPMVLTPIFQTRFPHITLRNRDASTTICTIVNLLPALPRLLTLVLSGTQDMPWDEPTPFGVALARTRGTVSSLRVDACDLFKMRLTNRILASMASSLRLLDIELLPVSEGHYAIFYYDEIRLSHLPQLTTVMARIPLCIQGDASAAQAQATPLIAMIGTTPPSLRSLTIALRRVRTCEAPFHQEVAMFPIDSVLAAMMRLARPPRTTVTVTRADAHPWTKDDFWHTVSQSSTAWATLPTVASSRFSVQ